MRRTRFLVAALGGLLIAAGPGVPEGGGPLHLPRLVVDRHYAPKAGDRAVLVAPSADAGAVAEARPRPRGATCFRSEKGFRDYYGRPGGDDAAAKAAREELEDAGTLVLPPPEAEVEVLSIAEVTLRPGERASLMARVRVVSGALKGDVLYVAGSEVNRLVPNPQFKAFGPEQRASRVVVIFDGQSLSARTPEGVRKLRLIGVADPAGVPPESAVESVSKETREFLKGMVGGDEVYVETDPALSRPDASGALPVYLYRACDGVFVNRWIIEQGYGQVARDRAFRCRAEFQEVERDAKEAERGLWSPLGRPGNPAFLFGVAVFAEPERHAPPRERGPGEVRPPGPPGGGRPPAPAPPPAQVPPAPRPQPAPAAPSSHYCGARTSKGTPCRRRVAGPGPGFCYQHRGD